MTTSTKLNSAQRKTRRDRLIGLAVWAAGEHAKKQLGLPSEWDQGTWIRGRGCNTVCCIAGKVALGDGAVPVVELDGIEVTDLNLARDLWLSGLDRTSNGQLIDFDLDRVLAPGVDEAEAVEDYAQVALHLDYEEAGRLFNGDNELDDVLLIIRDLIEDPA